jgi:hypothetical protein
MECARETKRDENSKNIFGTAQRSEGKPLEIRDFSFTLTAEFRKCFPFKRARARIASSV